VEEFAPARRNFFTKKTLCVAINFIARLCKIRHLAQFEADIGAVNKLYVEQRVKILMNQQKRIRREVDFVREGRVSVAKL